MPIPSNLLPPFLRSALLLTVALVPLDPSGASEGNYELTGPPEFFEGSSPDDALRFWHFGQAAENGLIHLTAANGFFDRVFHAIDQGENPADKLKLVSGFTFGALTRNPKATDDTRGSARWHLWLEQTAPIEAEIYLEVPESEAKQPWTFRLGDERHVISPDASDGKKPIAKISFQPNERGRIEFAIDCNEQLPPAASKFLRVRLSGPAIESANLLRARWRPAAVHGAFTSGAKGPRMWVFETMPADELYSYSPLTTPFGYFGTGFHHKRIGINGSFNFSMWIAGANATEAPPVEQCSRLIATGLPDAKFDYFGHEGTGCKFRDAYAYPKGADRSIQALRAEVDPETGMTTYYAYFYREEEARWILFGSGQTNTRGFNKENPEKFMAQINERGTLWRTGSFVEIPGPPRVERSGDQSRAVLRRGWFLDREGAWHPAVYEPKQGRDLAKERGEYLAKIDAGDFSQLNDPRRAPVNKRWGYQTEGGRDGWTIMSAGGMEFYPPIPEKCPLVVDGDFPPAAPTDQLPEYLQPDKAKQLFASPVQFGKPQVEAQSSTATIIYPLEATGPNSKAVLWYGQKDCATFIRQDKGHGTARGSAAYQDLMSPERTWTHSTPEQAVKVGDNRFALQDLTPGATYYFRLFVQHDDGKSWDYRSGSFTLK